jgi:putative SOS response-associated peptidase YedK
MPVILDPSHYDLWLDPGMQDVAAISGFLKPYDARLMRSYPASTRVKTQPILRLPGCYKILRDESIP